MFEEQYNTSLPYPKLKAETTNQKKINPLVRVYRTFPPSVQKVLNQFEDMPTFTINKKDILEEPLQKDFDFH
jgi:hypothetical protein